ncbi:ATP-binding SpoIIE family protein phosphatase [Aliidiomarina sp.]|uniref:ATP-binding SpoIIE family protein phosphatase n=1 Tax=Aliidiomarina sp. TaxID=1872439 RepID=UPI003A4D7A83
MQIAIVDEAKENRQDLAILVNAIGFNVVFSGSSVKALLAIEDRTIDLVLLNTALLNNDFAGKLVTRIKQLQPDIYLPIILIANDRNSTAILKNLQLGADDFHSKPFDSLILEAKLKAHLRTRELSKTLADRNRKLAWHNKNVQQEHKIVQNIFKNALSRNLLDYPHIDTFLLPHSRFNGDLYLIARGPIGNVYIMLGDFTGHGLAAAIGTLPASQTFFALAAQGAPISQIASEINRQLHNLLPESMFCCASFVELSASGERISWWSGGMPPAMLVGPEQRVGFLEPQHMPLGILDELEFESSITLLRVERGSKLFLYTDGAIEIGVQNNVALGYEGLRELCQNANWDFAKITHQVTEAISERGIDDDLSLVQLQCVATGFTHDESTNKLPQMPFTVNVKVGPGEIRGVDPIAHILRGLSQMEGFKGFKASLYTVLSEAYNNAVDHGLLRMSSKLKASADGFASYYQERSKRLTRLQQGEVEIALRYEPREALIHVQVRDSGPGFSLLNEDHHTFPYGRGLMLIRELTENMRWSDDGRCIEFAFSLKHRY